jgi:hypothetical protein
MKKDDQKPDIGALKKSMEYHHTAVDKIFEGYKRLKKKVLTPSHRLCAAAYNKVIADDDIDPSRSLPERLVNDFEIFGTVTPKLLRDPLVEPKVPKPLLDPLSGRQIGLPDNHTERVKFEQDYPELFAWLVGMEKNQISHLRAFNEKVRAFEQRRDFETDFLAGRYDDKFAAFMNGDLAAQSALIKNDPTLASFLKEEATQPAALPFDPERPNHTALARLAKDHPAVAERAREAMKLAAEWADLPAREAEEQFSTMVEVAKKHGWNLSDPAKGQTGERRKKDRKPMKLSKYGSAAQEAAQKEAAKKKQNG